MKKPAKLALLGSLSVLAIGAIVVGFSVSPFDGWAYSYSSVVASSNAAPNSTFLSSSISKTQTTDKYSRDCVVTAGTATSTQTLTREEQTEVDSFNVDVLKFKVRTISTTTGSSEKIFTSKEKTNVNGTVSVQIYVDAKGVYYPGDKAGAWKWFSDQTTIDAIFASVQTDDVTSYFDSAMSFLKWETVGKTRTAVYSGRLTPDGSANFVSSAFGQDLVAGQDIASAKIYIDEKTKLWTKYEVVIDKLKSGKVTFLLNGVCKITYGNAVKVKIPTGNGLKWVDAKTGATEMLEKMSVVW